MMQGLFGFRVLFHQFSPSLHVNHSPRFTQHSNDESDAYIHMMKDLVTTVTQCIVLE